MCHSSRPEPGAAPDPAQAQALISYILERFHEPHRRDLAAMLNLARQLEDSGQASGLAAGLQAFATALEAHLFKEEMRLFPMMEQGGGSLIGHLIADMQQEHQSHHGRIDALTTLLAGVTSAGAAAAALRSQGARLVADLLEHIHVEDDLLFPMFLQQAAPAAPRAGL